MKKRLIASVLIITLAIALQPTAVAADVGGRRITSRAAIVLDYETGAVLYEHNADVRRAPASMTKMMTVYLVLDAIDRGVISLDTQVPISQFVSDFSRRPGETNVPLTRNGHYTVNELLDVVIVMSAGGAAWALAELVGGGSRRTFVQMMNDTAEQWGIDAFFAGASGGSGHPHTNLTARAMAEITRNTIMRFPEVLERTSLPSVTFRGRTYWSTNQLLGVYYGIDGFKTGTNSEGGANFSGTAQRGNDRIIIVTMGSTHGGRFRDTEILLDYGFAALDRHAALPVMASFSVNGVDTDLRSFRIRDHNYVSIRDLAYVLSGTAAQFEVSWDNENAAILLARGVPYTPIGGELPGCSGVRAWHSLSNTRVWLDDEVAEFVVYTVGGNNFFQLRELEAAFGFDVMWDGDSRTVYLIADTMDDNEQTL